MSLETAVHSLGLPGILDGLREVLTDMRTELATLSAIRQDLESKPEVPRPEARAFYTVDETAKLLAKSAYTVRQWCNEGRLNANKRFERRGRNALWSIPIGEINRYQNEGLLPLKRRFND
jgi:hypothetical protein